MAKIEDAIVDLIVGNGTFYASLLSQMHRVVNRELPTIGVKISNGRITLGYNPDYLDPLSMKDTKLALEHECLHLVMEHDLRKHDKDHEKWNVAGDIAINQLLPSTPADYLTPAKMFGADMQKYNIQNNREAEYYYDLLDKSKEAKDKMKQMQADGKCGCSSKHESDGSGNELSKEVIKQMVGEAIKSSGQGHLPAGLEKYIQDLFTPSKVSWQNMLRRFVANSVKSGSRPSWKKPSRRYGSTQKGRIPARTISLTVVIDTSGSITDGALQLFMNEVTQIQKCYKSNITVLECDAEVGKEYKLSKFQKLNRKVTGGGGTSFKPPFKYIKQKRIKTDALIYFTDLCGDFPSKHPNVPVLWAYYDAYRSRSKVTVPFGSVVYIENESK